MDDLTGALRGGASFKKTELKVGYGAHRGFFIGLGEKVTERTTFPCKTCKGTGRKNDQECRACQGSGVKTDTKVPLLYQFGPELIQEEWVNFVLSEPGKLQDGTPKSGSTLWARMKSLSGVSDPAGINEWYRNLARPIKVPMEMMVIDSDTGAGCVIGSVRRMDPGAQQTPPVQAEPSEMFNEDDWAGLER